MALIKSYMSQYGVEGNYWKIRGFELTPEFQGGLLHLELYASKEARQSGAFPLETRTVQMVFNREGQVKLSDLKSLRRSDDMTVRDLDFHLRYVLLKEEGKRTKEEKEREDEARKRQQIPPEGGRQESYVSSYPFDTFLAFFADAEDDI